MVEKFSRDDTRDDDAISELSRKLPKSFFLSLSLSLSQTTNERDDGEKETKIDGGEKETDKKRRGGRRRCC
jgi:hypothetical protein